MYQTMSGEGKVKIKKGKVNSRILNEDIIVLSNRENRDLFDVQRQISSLLPEKIVNQKDQQGPNPKTKASLNKKNFNQNLMSQCQQST